jgi:hypothetical protein
MRVIAVVLVGWGVVRWGEGPLFQPGIVIRLHRILLLLLLQQRTATVITFGLVGHRFIVNPLRRMIFVTAAATATFVLIIITITAVFVVVVVVVV